MAEFSAIFKMHGHIQKWIGEFLEMVTSERASTQVEFDKIKAHLKEKHDEHDVLNDLVSATKDDMDDWAIKFRQDIGNTCSTQQQTIDEAKQHIQELAGRHRDGGEGAGEGGQRGGSGGRERRIFDDREYKIKDLPDKVAPAQFKKWVHEVELFLETAGESWKGIKALLSQCRRQNREIVPVLGPMFDDMVRTA